jgi:putative pyruvate formate lyase activating enzyme
MGMVALYVEAYRTGVLEERVSAARALLRSCELCPRFCGVDRVAGEKGVCGGGALAEVASAGAHFGEEPPLVGSMGSGTIFLSRCGLGCVFCQNREISHLGEGVEVSATQLAAHMVALQRGGCHNINLVTPTHYLPQILEALAEAAAAGLEVPLVWNCGGYEEVAALRLLEGIVDIYMPDIKFAESAPAGLYCGATDYFDRAREAVMEMHRQVGDLVIEENGLASRGLLVRHLVIPGGLAGTAAVARFLAEEISGETYLNLMDQYRPSVPGGEFPEIGRGITAREYESAREEVRRAGLHRGYV